MVRTQPGNADIVQVREIHKRQFHKNYYLIMNRQGDSLQWIYEKLCGQFTFKTAALIGLELLRIIERIHSCGFVYNDLRLENVKLGKTSMLKVINNEH